MVCLTLFLSRPFSAHQIYSLAYLVEFPCLSIPFLLAGLFAEDCFPFDRLLPGDSVAFKRLERGDSLRVRTIGRGRLSRLRLR